MAFELEWKCRGTFREAIVKSPGNKQFENPRIFDYLRENYVLRPRNRFEVTNPLRFKQKLTFERHEFDTLIEAVAYLMEEGLWPSS